MGVLKIMFLVKFAIMRFFVEGVLFLTQDLIFVARFVGCVCIAIVCLGLSSAPGRDSGDVASAESGVNYLFCMWNIDGALALANRICSFPIMKSIRKSSDIRMDRICTKFHVAE